MAAKIVPGLNTNDILSILDDLRPERQQTGDVTVAMAEDDWGVSKSCARDILEKSLKGGKLKKLKVVLYTGRPGVVYRPVL